MEIGWETNEDMCDLNKDLESRMHYIDGGSIHEFCTVDEWVAGLMLF